MLYGTTGVTDEPIDPFTTAESSTKLMDAFAGSGDAISFISAF